MSKTTQFSFSIPKLTLARAKERQQSLGYLTLAAYFQFLVEQDLELQPEHVRVGRDRIAFPAPVTPPPAPPSGEATVKSIAASLGTKKVSDQRQAEASRPSPGTDAQKKRELAKVARKLRKLQQAGPLLK